MGNCFNCLIIKKRVIKPRSTDISVFTVHKIDSVKDQDVYDEYKITSKIGSGKMAKTYQAIDPYGRRVAFKIINKANLPTEQISTSLIQSKQKIQNIEHSKIMKLYRVIETSKTIFLILEFAEKGSLETIIKRKVTFTFNSLRILTAQIAEALFFLNSKGITYGDLNLSNIFLNSTGVVKLSDVNNISMISMLDRNMEGTLCFIAPEIFKNSQPNLKTDIYALGVVLYILYYHQFPVFSKNRVDNPLIKANDIEAKNFGLFLNGLLELDQKKRIGRSMKDFQMHPFFVGFNWKTYKNDKMYLAWISDIPSISDFDASTKCHNDVQTTETFTGERDRNKSVKFNNLFLKTNFTKDCDFETMSESPPDNRKAKEKSRTRLSLVDM